MIALLAMVTICLAIGGLIAWGVSGRSNDPHPGGFDAITGGGGIGWEDDPYRKVIGPSRADVERSERAEMESWLHGD